MIHHKNLLKTQQVVQTFYNYIKEASELKGFVQEHLPNLDGFVIADTEFLRINSFYPIFSVLQIYHKNLKQPYVFDIAELAKQGDDALLNLGKLLKKFFYDENLISLFHAPYQDLEAIYSCTKKHNLIEEEAQENLTQNVYDSQIALQFLGIRENFSYENMVKEFLGIDLPEESPDYLSWLKRPLSNHHLEYAALDVLHLGECFEILQERLIKAGKWDFFKEEMANISKINAEKLTAEYNFSRIKLGQHYSAIELHLAKELCEFREEFAIKTDIPRNWVMKDDVISEIAIKKPRKLGELKRIKGFFILTHYFKGKLKGRAKPIAEEIYNGVLDIVVQTFSPNFKATEIERSSQRIILNTEAKEVYQKLQKHLAKCADQHNINASLIINSKNLKRLAYAIIRNEGQKEFLTGWRKEVWGEVK